MATKRPGRAGIFQGTSRTPRKRHSALAFPASHSGAAYSWDILSDALTWSPNAAALLGLNARDLPRTGKAFAQLVEPGSGADREEAIAVETSSHGSFETRYALRLGPDQVLMVEDAGRWQADAQGRPAFVRGLLKADVRLAIQALPTRIQARSGLLHQIQNGINEALRVSQTCTLIVGSLDGDDADALDIIARKLRPMMRRHDHFGALSPSRFTLTLTGCPASDASSAMTRAAGLLKDCSGHLTLSAACAPDHTFKATKLLRFAELALEAALAGNEAFKLYDARPASRSSRAEKAPFDVVSALNDRSLTLACRPVVDALGRSPVLMQAIAALPGPDGRMIPLGSVPALDDANLSLLVDGRMLELAADYLVGHPHERLALPVAPATLKDAEWLPMLAAHLGARPGIESRLVIEVPEIALAKDPSLVGRLHAMKAIGIGLSLSGFGLGHVPSASLRHLPFDMLKIDGVFIQPLNRSTEDRLFVRALVDRAQNLGIATAAEWVHDEATARMLADWGVDYLEGSLFGEPAAVQEPASLKQVLKKARA
ncbi:EAL domain-containing protein [Microvirga sp. ACRRW]|uniref:bifunctional diguanylate cyclase/phosphodiesterase n=1 Tax=Microvirga sp. ACRRW TaxID=2918205 RepID=UPI001EF58254|nr:bifunctional diguanylate cyclase/phosphodiesterase [Microvirga sp. ACRRW]MCG7393532.1 EAL domain-containing protein [Microvirga sp. ACRRW]